MENLKIIEFISTVQLMVEVQYLLLLQLHGMAQ
jgi:hypothetical protein